ncbi:hypothetical protein GCM10017764_29420 [Sphingobacterium griseoflavum]|uniref:Uncharacterized protein n=1 Tax=Sphingobacterium griseoflavum TaxID=1474952 RepID=A0ABQ3HXT0_9SPHI|nr:hypothetical protein GCM10017764_29420 [Sphingobacterium griseoflavum]
MSFDDTKGNNTMKLEIEANYKEMKKDIAEIIEIERITNAP